MKRYLLTRKAPKPRRTCLNRSISSDGASNTIAKPPSGPTSTPDGDARSVKSRKWGNRALPLSPLMDPVKIEQRNKHKQMKLPPPKNADLTPFQKALVNNPYARALASSVRLCRITGARLPSFFLIPFEFHPHPEPPHQICIVPTRLFAENTPGVAIKRRGAVTYAESRQTVIRFVTKARRNDALLTYQLKQTFGAKHRRSGTGTKWRKDMDEFVLGLLRQAVIGSLRWGLSHPKAGLVERCDEGACAAQDIDSVACFVYKDTIKMFTDLEARVQRIMSEVQLAENGVRSIQEKGMKAVGMDPLLFRGPPALTLAVSHPPATHTVVQYRDRIVPVYSLTDLLGEEKMAELLKNTAFEDARAFVIKEGNLTTNAQLALLRLQEYLL